MIYVCSSCGQGHDGLPYIGADRPQQYWDVPESERGRRVVLTPERCVIDDRFFFTRGVLEIPIIDHASGLCFVVWISQQAEEFFAYRNHPDSDEIGPFPGRLASRMMYFDKDTFLLKATIRFLGGGHRPRIELSPAKHSLVFMQDTGITLSHAREIVNYYMDS